MKRFYLTLVLALCYFESIDAKPAITNDLILFKHGLDIPKDVLVKILEPLLDPLMLTNLRGEGPRGTLYFSLLNLWFPHFTPLTNIFRRTLQSLVQSNSPNFAQVINFLMLPLEAIPKFFTTLLEFLPFSLILPAFGPFGFYLLWKTLIRHRAIQILYGENLSLLSLAISYLAYSTIGFFIPDVLFQPIQIFKNVLSSVAFAPEWTPFVAQLPVIFLSLFLLPISNFFSLLKLPGGLEKFLLGLPPIFISLLTRLPINIAILGPLGAFVIIEIFLEALFDFFSPILSIVLLPFFLPFIAIFKTLNGIVSLFNPFQPLSLRLIASFATLQFFSPFSNIINSQIKNITNVLSPLIFLPFAFLPLIPGFEIFLLVFGPLLSIFGRIAYQPIKILIEFLSGNLLGPLLSTLRPFVERLAPLFWILAPSLGTLLPFLQSLLSPFDDILKVLIPPLFPILWPLSIILSFLGPDLVKYLGPLLAPLMPVITTVLLVLGPILGPVSGILAPLKSTLFPVLGPLVTGVGAVLNPVLFLLGPVFWLLSPLLWILVPILSLVTLLLGIIL